MSTWPPFIWVTRDGAERCEKPDPNEPDDAMYVHISHHNDTISERNSWRDIATRLIEEKHNV